MPAPRFLSGLPKPLLLGLYGALGGLFGGLVFGELLWAVLQPPRPPPPEPQVAIGAAADLQIYQGGTNRCLFEIARDGFDAAVTVHVEGLPEGVHANSATVEANELEGELTLHCDKTTRPKVGPIELSLVATAKVDGKLVTATTVTQLSVLEAPLPLADIVFVLDVTGSMQEQIDGLKNGIGTFAKDLFEAKVDARFACLAFRDEDIGQRSQLLTFNGKAFTANAADFRNEVGRLIAIGGGDGPESSYEALIEAAKLTDFRKLAVRTLVLITDAPPKSVGGQRTKSTIAADTLRGNHIDSLHLVIHPAHEPFYLPVQAGAVGVGGDQTTDRGRVFDFDRAARDSTMMTNTLLPQMTQAIVAAAEAKRPTPPQQEIRPQAAVLTSLQSTAVYDPTKKGRLVVAVGAWTGAIAAFVCLSLVAGQHHYLRGELPGIGSILAGLGGGLVVGLVGGAAGQGLYFLAPESVILGSLVRVLGWALLGALAGTGLSFFVPNLKVPLGLIGGLIGGIAGALAYIGAEAVADELIGRIAGGLSLGFCIGLMVAIVEAAFRRAWLEVSYGPREKISVNLGPEPVKIGGDTRICTVWARGAPDVALRYFIRGGQVICNDVAQNREFLVGNGDSRVAGNVTVVVRHGTGTMGTATPVPPPPPPPPAPRSTSAKALPPSPTATNNVAPNTAQPTPTSSKNRLSPQHPTGTNPTGRPGPPPPPPPPPRPSSK